MLHVRNSAGAKFWRKTSSLKRDPFEAGVVSYVLSVFWDAATFELPTTGDVIDIIECLAIQTQTQEHKHLIPVTPRL